MRFRHAALLIGVSLLFMQREGFAEEPLIIFPVRVGVESSVAARDPTFSKTKEAVHLASRVLQLALHIQLQVYDVVEFESLKFRPDPWMRNLSAEDRDYEKVRALLPPQEATFALGILEPRTPSLTQGTTREFGRHVVVYDAEGQSGDTIAMNAFAMAHELVHVFGGQHSDDSEDLMAHYTEPDKQVDFIRGRQFKVSKINQALVHLAEKVNWNRGCLGISTSFLDSYLGELFNHKNEISWDPDQNVSIELGRHFVDTARAVSKTLVIGYDANHAISCLEKARHVDPRAQIPKDLLNRIQAYISHRSAADRETLSERLSKF